MYFSLKHYDPGKGRLYLFVVVERSKDGSMHKNVFVVVVTPKSNTTMFSLFAFVLQNKYYAFFLETLCSWERKALPFC